MLKNTNNQLLKLKMQTYFKPWNQRYQKFQEEKNTYQNASFVFPAEAFVPWGMYLERTISPSSTL